MSARSFRLATVLRVRRIQEEQARGALAQARGAIVLAEDDARMRAVRASATALPSTAGASAYLAAVAHGLALASDAATARAAVAEVEAVAEEKQGEWREAAGKVKPLEHLEEAHREELRRSDERQAQAVQDEIAGARHASNTRGSRTGNGTSVS